MIAKIITPEMSCVVKAILAKFSHDFFSVRSVLRLAAKKVMVDMIEATNASNTKKCPMRPGNKCSPSNSMSND